MAQTKAFKAWCVANDVKQKDIAELLHISQQSAWAKMNGKQQFTLPQVTKICQKYAISADVFVG